MNFNYIIFQPDGSKSVLALPILLDRYTRFEHEGKTYLVHDISTVDEQVNVTCLHYSPHAPHTKVIERMREWSC